LAQKFSKIGKLKIWPNLFFERFKKEPILIKDIIILIQTTKTQNN
jgi:hypothetical protein